MTRVFSFAPIADTDCRLLILGSMPGVASLRAQQYYAHPQNAFWKIMGELLATAPDASYETRVASLKHHGIAVWDVMQSCLRPGSLDAAIAPASIVANDFAGFYAGHWQLGRVFFNGSAAEQTYRRLVLPALDVAHAGIRYTRLPSTSPAHASMTYAAKLAAWREVLQVPESITSAKSWR